MQIKQSLIIILSSLLRGITWLAKKIGQVFLFILWPVGKIFQFLCRYLLVPVYHLLYQSKKHLKANFDDQVQNKLAHLLTHKYILYVLIFILSFSVLYNNFVIRTSAAEDLGKKSLFYQLAQGDEFEEVIEEVGLDVEEYGKDKLAQKETLEPDFLDPQEMALVKNEPGTAEIDTSTLQESTTQEGLAAETLTKTSAPATLTTPKPRQEVQEYEVQSGDTISTIAEKFGISINTILWTNDISGLSIIRPGDKLTIMPVTGVLHKVVKNDTISGIAKKYNVEQEKVLSYNKLVSNNQLQIGQLIIVPDGEVQRTYQRTASGFAAVFKPSSSQKKAGGFIWPTSARYITQYYHWRHHGLDIASKTGTPIYAALDGKVIKAGWSNGYGYHLIIDHGGSRKTLYAHLSKMYVQRGDQVTQGAAIGAMGSTGWSSGPHLHFEIIINGTKVNPLSYL